MKNTNRPAPVVKDVLEAQMKCIFKNSKKKSDDCMGKCVQARRSPQCCIRQMCDKFFVAVKTEMCDEGRWGDGVYISCQAVSILLAQPENRLGQISNLFG